MTEIRIRAILVFEKKNFRNYLQKFHIVKIAEFSRADLPRGLKKNDLKNWGGGESVFPIVGHYPFSIGANIREPSCQGV